MMLILKGILLGFVIAEFRPLQELLIRIQNKINSNNVYVNYFFEGFTCWKCLSFWSTLILSQNIYYAAGAALIVYLTSMFLPFK